MTKPLNIKLMKDMTLEEKQAMIVQSGLDARDIIQFVRNTQMDAGRFLTALGHVLGSMIASKIIDDEDLRTLYQLAIQAEKLYSELKKEEDKE